MESQVTDTSITETSCHWQFCDYSTTDVTELLKHLEVHIETALPIRRSRVNNPNAGESFFPSLASN